MIQQSHLLHYFIFYIDEAVTNSINVLIKQMFCLKNWLHD